MISFILRLYRLFLSPLLGGQCRFYPSCSAYLETALEKYPAPRALWMALTRLLRCHPWHGGGVDIP